MTTTTAPTSIVVATDATPRTRVLGLAVIAFPLLLIASDAAHYAETGSLSGQTGAVIQVWIGPALGLAYFGLVGLIQHRLPRVAALLTVLGAVSAAGAVAFGVETLHVALGADSLVEGDGFAGIAATALPGIFTPLALMGCGIALWRAHIGPRWAAPALAIGGLLFPASRIGEVAALVVVTDLVLAAAFVAFGLLLLRAGTRHDLSS